MKLALALGAMIAALITAPALAGVPVPKAVRVPDRATSYAFGGAAHTMVPEDLAKVGYVEEEYFLSGTANVYEWTTPGPATVRTPNAPYTTRVLVRRPISKVRFSGRVVVEMLNPSNLFDLNLAWAVSSGQIVRNGDAWVGLTAKPVAAVTLKTFDPVRYGAISFANPLPATDARNCAVTGDGAKTSENGLVWDMNSQAGAWIRSRDPSNPFTYGSRGGPHPVKRLYGWGYSQTGGYLYTYINAIAPQAPQDNGKPMFDGYLVAVAAGPSAINQCAGPIPAGDSRRQITNAGVPVIHIMSQSDYLGAIPSRRPDSDAPGDLYRHYEIAGGGHATPAELYTAARPEDLIKGGRTPPPMDCTEGPRSRFPTWLQFDAALRNLEDWAEKGVAPPKSEPIKVEKGAAVLDGFGNVQGGWRSPLVDVPTSKWYGNSTGASFCRIAGHEEPFDAARLKSLYPTHADYVAKVTASVRDLVSKRLIVKEDGDRLIAEAKAAKIPY